jgi:ribosomal protein S18 acetylase RimI-like enzyme
MNMLSMPLPDTTRAPAATQSAFTIRQARKDDEAEFRGLWAEYLAFSRVELPSSVTDATCERIVTPSSAMKALVATDLSGSLVGFAVYVLHPYSFGEGEACLVDDLYVHTDTRGLGIGKALISHLIERADGEGWSKVYWVADEDNVAARALFDRHFTECDGFVRYSVRCGCARAEYGFRIARPESASPSKGTTP